MKSRDESALWHPYTQHGLNANIIPVKSAKGIYLELEDGSKVIDAISSWWVNIHGHGHPALAKAIYDQASRLDHVLFAGFTHEPALKLAEILLQETKTRNFDFGKVFFSDNGSTAVEVALKMAFQYHRNRKDLKRTRFLALKGSYHGDTLAAMSVSEPEGFHSTFKMLMPEVTFVEPGDLNELEKVLSLSSTDFAAFIFEPLIQGAAGMKTYSKTYLEDAVKLCHQHGLLTIADEVFTGFYRCGKFLASELTEISPDLMCLSKGITGGILPLAVTLAKNEIYEAFKTPHVRDAFLHGHSYTANPIACAAALASWDLLQTASCQEQILAISQENLNAQQRFEKIKNVDSARSLGTLLSVELKTGESYFSANPAALTRFALERGVLLRPLGNVIYCVPPYCTQLNELKKIHHVMEEIANGI